MEQRGAPPRIFNVHQGVARRPWTSSHNSFTLTGNHLLRPEDARVGFLTEALATICHPRPLGTSCKTHLSSGLLVFSGSGTVPASSNAASSSVSLCIKRVAPPSSPSWSHPPAPGNVRICSERHQHSRGVSPLHPRTVTVPAVSLPIAA